MDKNSFLIFNDIVCHLYTCRSTEDLTQIFLPRLKLLIPYTYASILLADPDPHSQNLFLPSPYCVPESFCEAEQEYIRHAEEDPLLWLVHGKESTLVRESDLLQEERRLNSPLYLHCYQKYNIFDTLQNSIVFQEQFLGILTLFRTRIDGLFTDEDMFYLRSLGMHLNAVLHRICSPDSSQVKTELPSLARRYQLTERETNLLDLLLAFKTNDEIAAALSIRENTVQKHLQNIYRKLGVTSKWELLKFLWC